MSSETDGDLADEDSNSSGDLGAFSYVAPDDEDEEPASQTIESAGPLAARTPDDEDEDGDEDEDEDDEDDYDEAIDGDGAYSIRQQFGTVFDIIDKMTEEITEAPSKRFSPDTILISRSALLDELDQLERCLPRQLNDASKMMRRADQRLEEAETQARAIQSEAQAKAAATIATAEQRADEIADQQNVVAIANARAQQIVEKAQMDADQLVVGADEYAENVMNELARRLRNVTKQVNEGTAAIKKNKEEARRELERLQGADDEDEEE